jgi:signal transduction histidine kinase
MDSGSSLRGSAQPGYAAQATPGTGPRPRLDGVNPPARAHGVDLLWLVPLAVVVLVGSWFTNLPEEHAAPAGYQPWLAAALGAAAVTGLLGSLRWPLRGTAATFGAVTAFVVLDLRDGPIYLSLAAAAFLVAARVRLRAWLRVVVAGTLAACLGLVLRSVADYDNQRSLWQLVAVLAVTAAGAAIGTLTRGRALAVIERARTVATQEQLRVAQGLHDGVGHGLAVIAMQAGVGLHVLDRDPAAVRVALEAIRDSARESLDALRAEVAQISGEHVPGEPAPRRPRQGVGDLGALVDRVRTAGLTIEVTGSPGELPEPVSAVVYGVVQEGLTNVLRHASATTVSVRLDRSPERVAVTVEDDGRGAGQPTRPDEGMGLRGMRERVQALGGDFSAGPRSTGGFAVHAVLPL